MQSPPDSSPPRPLRVLLVEDHDDSRAMITEFLRFESMEITAVGCMADAQEALSRLQFDALVSDLRLPDGDGYALIKGLRESSSPNRGIPAIGITAHPETESRARALAAGFDDYVPKVSTASLGRKLAEVRRLRS